MDSVLARLNALPSLALCSMTSGSCLCLQIRMFAIRALCSYACISSFVAEVCGQYAFTVLVLCACSRGCEVR
jgi:hypothetical protein